MRALLLSVIVLLTFATARAQNPAVKKPVDTTKNRIDTIKPAPYVNQGKIAGRKAFHRSLIFPGLGQVYNYGLVVNDVKSGATKGNKFGQKLYIIGKIGAIYAGGTLLVMSYMDNNKNYKLFLDELQYRKLHNNTPDPENGLSQYTNTDALVVAKNIFKRNREVVLLSLVGLYGLNALDAYVTARLKYFNVDDNLSFKISPSLLNSSTMYGYNPAVPALKLTIKL
ncbi:hypothetical protein GM921_00250 [Pedobacter sp. LMG 31464]|uniref:DUF5683 domain-containing protein n=1 Tax=Pedobacter planticolens TaxID=2679964 RepID=A0A923DWE3_9SPHI|nr:DUF5683 domain-containing protein [Pedobacter planticolens]MBB2143900.1 hypothetical protein [Pedobacter planticolens]